MRSLRSLLCLIPLAASAEAPDAATLFQANCAAGHGVGRLGLTGPALLPESLSRLRPDAAAGVVT